MVADSITPVLRELKLRARVIALTGRQRLVGESTAHAKHLRDTTDFPVCWSEFVTPIRDRGSAPEFSSNRLFNMEKARRLIDGLEIGPGEVFRFFARVPRPVERNGFRGGPIFKDGEIGTDVGGGLCQVSTNLFNALLLADLDIIDRRNHSMDPWGEARFVPLGRDAAVAWGYKDLAARNTHSVAVQVRLTVDHDVRRVVASVWGPSDPTPKVSVTSKVLAEVPGTTTDAVSGWQVETVRTSQRDGRSVETYRAVDTYRPYEPASTS